MIHYDSSKISILSDLEEKEINFANNENVVGIIV